MPRVESTPQGDFWIVDSQISGAIGLDASAGRKPEDFKPFGLTYKDMRPGSYDPKARLADMDIDGVDAEVLYFGGPVTQYPKDPELRTLRRPHLQRLDGRAVEGGAHAPGRPRAHPAGRPRRGHGRAASASPSSGCAASTSIRSRTSAAASRSGIPAYEPFWSLVEETGLPISFHIVGPRNANVAATFMNPTPGVKETFIAIAPISICEVVSTLVFTGILARHPKLHFVLVECGIGWIPYFVERMDQTFNKHRFWTKSIITEKPSTYWYRQGHATFIQDLAGVAERAPRRARATSCGRPTTRTATARGRKSREALAEHFEDVPADERRADRGRQRGARSTASTERRPVVVSGAASGIGAALRARLERDGIPVIGVDLRDADGDGRPGHARGRAAAIWPASRRPPAVRWRAWWRAPDSGRTSSDRAAIVHRSTTSARVALLDGLALAIARPAGPPSPVSSNSSTLPDADVAAGAACLDGDEATARRLAAEMHGASVYAGAKRALDAGAAATGAGVGRRRRAPERRRARVPSARRCSRAPSAIPILGPALRDFPVPARRLRDRPSRRPRRSPSSSAPSAAFCAGSVLFVDGGTDALLRPDTY